MESERFMVPRKAWYDNISSSGVIGDYEEMKRASPRKKFESSISEEMQNVHAL